LTSAVLIYVSALMPTISDQSLRSVNRPSALQDCLFDDDDDDDEYSIGSISIM